MLGFELVDEVRKVASVKGVLGSKIRIMDSDGYEREIEDIRTVEFEGVTLIQIDIADAIYDGRHGWPSEEE